MTKPALRDMVANMFGGKPSAVIQHLLEDPKIDEAELAEIRKLLDDHAKTSRTSSAQGRPTK